MNTHQIENGQCNIGHFALVEVGFNSGYLVLQILPRVVLLPDLNR